jgi:hypothetical protein
MLKNIAYIFPNSTVDSQTFFKQLIGLLIELPNAHIDEKGDLILTPLKPTGALPTTTFSQSDVPFPQLKLGDEENSLTVGNFRINPDTTSNYTPNNHGFDHILSKRDALGTYFEIHFASSVIYRLPMDNLIKRLKGHIMRIDHTGINIPSAQISNAAWSQFINNIAEQTNLYKYPTNDVWPFILPATEDEFKNDITQFPRHREPKFEIVYDTYDSSPTIQIDIETDLTRIEIEQLLPEPYGISFPEVADFFRTVYVHHEWSGLAIRFDIRFKSEGPSDWDTGKWLVEDGGRYPRLDSLKYT